MICTLSDSGLLQCCYLGTDPVSTSIPSVMPSTTINVQEAEEQLAVLNKQIKDAMNDPSKGLMFEHSIFICVILQLW
jgi:hypothetical protein